MPKISIILSTYNQPKWLYKVLVGYEQQSFKSYEIIIADDGSTAETSDLIKSFQKQSNLKIIHVWHEDDGFQKTKILNKAIMSSQSDYLIFSDGDCIPRFDFVEKHFTLRKSKSFLSGGYFKLPKSISEAISKEDISSQKCFEKQWLINLGLKLSFKLNKLTSTGFKERFLNAITPTKATWDGMNASGWKRDIVAVNGFDERMQYGGEDRELGERLINRGVKPVQIRYSAICLHLYHERDYKDKDALDVNLDIRKETKSQKRVWTAFGIKQ
jgi:glycosyltransferase involved in cell wall biosynthesis